MTTLVFDDLTGSPGSMAGRTVGGRTWVDVTTSGYPVLVLDGAGHAGSNTGSASQIGMAFGDDLSTTDYIDFSYTFAIAQDDGETDFEVGAKSHGDAQPGNFYVWMVPGLVQLQWWSHSGFHSFSYNILAGDVVTLRIPTVDVGYTAELLINGVSMYLYGTAMFDLVSPLYLLVTSNMAGMLDAIKVETHAGEAPPPDVVPFHIRDDFNGTRKSILNQVPNIITGVSDVSPAWKFNTTSIFPTPGTPTDNSNYGWLQSGAGYCWIKSGTF